MPREEIFKKFKAGTLHSGKGGPIVKDRKQAIAIAMKYGSMKGLSEMPMHEKPMHEKKETKKKERKEKKSEKGD